MKYIEINGEKTYISFWGYKNYNSQIIRATDLNGNTHELNYNDLKEEKTSDEMLNDEKMANYMNSLLRCGDIEQAHCIADEILCEILERYGYKKTVEAFDGLDKWYA